MSLEKNISTLIHTQFPGHYRETGPTLVAFVEAYYKWLEEPGNELYMTRRFFEYTDVDETIDDFLVYFKETFLKGIQFETTSNIRMLLKHSLDLYRAKGSEQAIDLLFKIVFGETPEIYYPSTDVFKLSDGQWYKPRYIELSISESNIFLRNKQIVGYKTGAKAFVENVVRRKSNDVLLDVLYISAIEGEFELGELINSFDFILPLEKCPTIVGSLNELELNSVAVGSNFEIGDLLNVTSKNGTQALAKVTAIDSVQGLIDFELINGGYGYSANAETIISEKILTIESFISGANNFANTQLFRFEKLIQPKATISYISATANLVIGEEIFSYHANNLLKGYGRIITAAATNSTAGEIKVSIFSGNLNVDRVYTTANAKQANISSYTDTTVSANICGINKEAVISINNISGEFSSSEYVYQIDNYGNILAQGFCNTYIEGLLNTGVLNVANTRGIFRANTTIVGGTSNATANITGIQIQVGVFETNGDFVTTSNNFVYTEQSNGTGSIKSVSNGAGAGFSISNNFLYEETVLINTDYLADYLTVELDATSYGFPANAAANLTTCTIDEALAEANVVIGKIQEPFVAVNQGADYTDNMYILIHEPMTYQYRRPDVKLDIANASIQFAEGELVTQEATGARGIIKPTSNSTVFYLERLRLKNQNNFIVTSNTTTRLVGDESGATANITAVDVELECNYIGFNANVISTTKSQGGSITSLEVLDSGFGFANGELVVASSVDSDNFVEGSIVAVVNKHGRGRGYYRKKGGFLSDQKKIFDGYYYQNYSYEIRSSLPLNKYEQMLKNIVHVVGTQYFAKTIINSEIITSPSIKSEITVS